MKPDPSAIKPKVRGVSDFFSWQLFRWAKAKPESCQIWRGTWSSFGGVDADNPVLYIGNMDGPDIHGRWLHGRMLRNLCCYGQNINGYAYGPAHDTRRWVEVTDEWWAEYMRIGVCAIHDDNSHSWDRAGDIRTCRHCGKVEQRRTVMVPKEQWEAV